MKITTYLIQGYDVSGGDATFDDTDVITNAKYAFIFIISNLAGAGDAVLTLQQLDDGKIFKDIVAKTITDNGTIRFVEVCIKKTQLRAKLEVNGMTGGILSGRTEVTFSNKQVLLTTIQRDAIDNEENGTQILRKEGFLPEYWDGKKWKSRDACVMNHAILPNNNIAPAQLTASQDDWNPEGLEDANSIHMSMSSPSFVITGLQAPVPPVPQLILIVNVGSVNVNLRNNDSGSLEANRFLMSGNRTISGNDAAIIKYDPDNLRWRLFSIT